MSGPQEIDVDPPFTLPRPSPIAIEADLDPLADNIYVQQYGLNGHDSDGVTPLFLACIEGREKVVKSLLKAKANVDTKNNDGCSALLAACVEGHNTIVAMLLESKADVSQSDNNGYTALHWAALGGKEQTARDLLQAGAKVNAQDNEGRTALYIAAQGGYESLVGTLIEAKAETLLRDNNGRTPMSMAAQRRHESIVRLIAQAKTSDDKRSPSTTPERPSISISITRFDFCIHTHERGSQSVDFDHYDSELESPIVSRNSLTLPHPKKPLLSSILPQSPKVFEALPGLPEED